jgi:hypothetical protein
MTGKLHFFLVVLRASKYLSTHLLTLPILLVAVSLTEAISVLSSSIVLATPDAKLASCLFGRETSKQTGDEYMYMGPKIQAQKELIHPHVCLHNDEDETGHVTKIMASRKHLHLHVLLKDLVKDDLNLVTDQDINLVFGVGDTPPLFHGQELILKEFSHVTPPIMRARAQCHRRPFVFRSTWKKIVVVLF